MSRFGKKQVTEEEFQAAKKPMEIWMLMLVLKLSQNELKQKVILCV